MDEDAQTSGQPATAQGISACVLGGVSLTGGVGTITGVIVGVLIMGTVQNAMSLPNIAPFYQYAASGSILLAAVLFDRLKQRRSAQRVCLPINRAAARRGTAL